MRAKSSLLLMILPSFFNIERGVIINLFKKLKKTEITHIVGDYRVSSNTIKLISTIDMLRSILYKNLRLVNEISIKSSPVDKNHYDCMREQLQEKLSALSSQRRTLEQFNKEINIQAELNKELGQVIFKEAPLARDREINKR